VSRITRDTYSLPDLFNRFIAVSFSALVSTEEEGFRIAIVKSDQTMLPIADVITKPDIGDGIAEIEAVEVEPEGIDDPIAFVHYYQDCRGITSPASPLIADLLATVSLAQFLFEDALRFLMLIGRIVRRNCARLRVVIPLGTIFLRVAGDIPIDPSIPIGPRLLFDSPLGYIPLPLQPRRPTLHIIIAGQVHGPTLFPLIQISQVA
jgi:hypothetical protein